MQSSKLLTGLEGLRLAGGLALLAALSACGGSGSSAFSNPTNGSTGGSTAGAGSSGGGSSTSSSTSSSSSGAHSTSGGNVASSSSGGSSGGPSEQEFGLSFLGFAPGDTFVMLLNGGSPVTLTVSKSNTAGVPMWFSPEAPYWTLPVGAHFSVTVGTAPSGKTCTVTNGTGTIAIRVDPVPGVICTRSDSGSSATAFTSIGLTPSARQGAAVWTDAAGNLWLFGGQSQSSAGVPQTLCDLWRYSASAHAWTLMSVPGSEVPPARSNAASWTDLAGTLWLFGGQGSSSEGIALLGDLWKFEPGSGVWTDVGAAYTAGDATEKPLPPARMSAADWIDPNGDLWLFGGYGLSAAQEPTPLNDLWVYSPSAQSWTAQPGSRVAAR